MRRHAQRHAVQSGAGEIADGSAPCDRNDERQRARPEFLRQGERRIIEPPLRAGRLDAREMRDQRVEGRAPLGGVKLGDGTRIGGVGAKAVNRLRRKGDEAALAQHGGRSGDARRVGR